MDDDAPTGIAHIPDRIRDDGEQVSAAGPEDLASPSCLTDVSHLDCRSDKSTDDAWWDRFEEIGSQILRAGRDTNVVKLQPSLTHRDEVGSARSAALAAVDELQVLEKRADCSDQASAREALVEILLRVTDPYRVIDEPVSGWMKVGRRVEERLDDAVDSIRALCGGSPDAGGTERSNSMWGWFGLGLTLVAGGLVIESHLLPATFLILSRTLISLVKGTPGFPADVVSRGRVWYVNWVGCVLGHATDAVALAAVSTTLIVHERTVWGAVVFAVVITTLTSTLFRVAALQDGIWLRRLYVERVARNGGLLLGILATLMLQGSQVPKHGVPVLAFAAVGSGIYSVFEILRIRHYTKALERRRQGEDSYITFTRAAANVVGSLKPTLQGVPSSGHGPFTGTEGRKD